MPRSNAAASILNTLLRAQGRDRQAGVVELMSPEQSWRRQIHQAAIVLIDQPAALDADMPLLPGRVQRRPQAGRLRFDHGHRLGKLLGADHRHLALDDRGLLAGDGGQRVAKKLSVIHADRRDHRCKRRVDHIGRVQASAKADFQQHDVRRMLREQAKGRRGLRFENGDRRAGIG